MLPDPYNGHVDISGGTETTTPYTVINMSGNAVDRKNYSSAAGGPRKLKISHTTAGKGDAKRDRHLVRLEAYVVEDGIENPAKPIALFMVADIPQVGVTDSQKTQLFESFVGLVRGASGDAANEGDESEFFTRFLGGES